MTVRAGWTILFTVAGGVMTIVSILCATGALESQHNSHWIATSTCQWVASFFFVVALMFSNLTVHPRLR